MRPAFSAENPFSIAAPLAARSVLVHRDNSPADPVPSTLRAALRVEWLLGVLRLLADVPVLARAPALVGRVPVLVDHVPDLAELRHRLLRAVARSAHQQAALDAGSSNIRR